MPSFFIVAGIPAINIFDFLNSLFTKECSAITALPVMLVLGKNITESHIQILFPIIIS